MIKYAEVAIIATVNMKLREGTKMGVEEREGV